MKQSTCCKSNLIHIMDNKYICSECHERNKGFNYFGVKILIALIILVICFFFLIKVEKGANINCFKLKEIKKENLDIQLNDSSILNFLIQNNSPCPSLGLAQLKLESTYKGKPYNSPLVHYNHNLGGIRGSKRKHSIGMKGGYNNYSSYKNFLLDFIETQKVYSKNIDGKYAEDPNYLSKLKQIK